MPPQAQVDLRGSRVGGQPHDGVAVVGGRERTEHAVVPGVALDALDRRGPVRQQHRVQVPDRRGDRAAVAEVPRDRAQGVLRDPAVQVRLRQPGEPLVRAEGVLAGARVPPQLAEQLLAVALGQVLQQEPAAVTQPRARPVQLRAAHEVGGVADPPGGRHGGEVGGAGGPEGAGVVGREAATRRVEGREALHHLGEAAGQLPRRVELGAADRGRAGGRGRGLVPPGGQRGDLHPQESDAVDHAPGRAARLRRQAAHRRDHDLARRRARAVRPGPVDHDDDLVPGDRPVRLRDPEVVHVEGVQRVELRDGAVRVEPERAGRVGRVRAGEVAPGEDDVATLAHMSALPRLRPRHRHHERLVRAQMLDDSGEPEADHQGHHERDGERRAASPSTHAVSVPSP